MFNDFILCNLVLNAEFLKKVIYWHLWFQEEPFHSREVLVEKRSLQVCQWIFKLLYILFNIYNILLKFYIDIFYISYLHLHYTLALGLISQTSL